MAANKYPINEVDYLRTCEWNKNIEKRVYGVDCEMVLSDKGYELARISLCNEDMEIIYD